MAKDNGSKILLGLNKDCKVERVREEEGRIVVMVTLEVKEMACPYCGSLNLYRHGRCKPRQVLHSWSNGRKVYLELHRHRTYQTGTARGFMAA